MKWIHNIKIRNKLILLAVLPLAGLVYFSISEISAKRQLSAEMANTIQMSRLSVLISSLVHETQKERGMTAGFLGSKGNEFRTQLTEQRNLTGTAQKSLTEFLGHFDITALGTDVAADMQEATRLLERLPTIRDQVTALTITAGDAVGYYTNVNASLLNTVAALSLLSSEAEIVNMSTAYVNFLKSKERAGVERAVLTNTFAAEKFGPGMFQKEISLIAAQDNYTDVFLSLAGKGQIDFYKSTMTGECMDQTSRMRAIALEKAAVGGFGVDATHWFKMQTEKINRLKVVEDKLSADLVQRADELYSHARTALLLSALLSLVVLSLTVFVTLTIVRGITRPVQQVITLTEQMSAEFTELTEVLEAIANNDLTREVKTSVVPSIRKYSNDEIGMLVDSVVHTLNSKNAMTESLGKMSGNITQIIQTIDQCSRDLVQASNEISALASQMSSGSQQQSNQITQVSAAIQQMSASIALASDNAAVAKDTSRGASDTASEGGQIVSSTIEGMHRITMVSRKSSDSIQELAKSMNQIGEIIGVIADIADQTNLLALNAAIESARAGEQGRGFAVVADEVRKLAERTGKATNEISDMIKSVQRETKGAVQSMESGVSEVENGRGLADRAGNALGEVVKISHLVMDMITQIASATNEQSTVAEEISKNVEHIAAVTKETAAGAKKSASASESLRYQAQCLRGTVEKFKMA